MSKWGELPLISNLMLDIEHRQNLDNMCIFPNTMRTIFMKTSVKCTDDVAPFPCHTMFSISFIICAYLQVKTLSQISQYASLTRINLSCKTVQRCFPTVSRFMQQRTDILVGGSGRENEMKGWYPGQALNMSDISTKLSPLSFSCRSLRLSR